MGMFTWRTIADEKIGSEERTILSDMIDELDNCLSVHQAVLLHPNGTDHVVGDYNGYGVFGGVDVFAYVMSESGEDSPKNRDAFFTNYSENRKLIKFITTDALQNYDGDFNRLPSSKSCISQGFMDFDSLSDWRKNI